MFSHIIRILPLFLILGNTLVASPRESQQPPSKEKKKLSIPEYYKSPKITERFDSISLNGHYALIPKGCIVYLPEAHKKKVGSSIGKGTMIQWKDFYPKRKNWIHIVPLTKTQAFGTKNTPKYKIPYEKLGDLKKLGRIIICTYNNTPVRVKVQVKPAE